MPEKPNETPDKVVGRVDIGSIYEKYRAALKGFIYKKTGSENDSEDILHTVFLNLSRIDQVDKPIEHMSSWLYSVAKNLIIDRKRKKREERLPARTDSDTDFFSKGALSDSLAGDENDPEKNLLRSVIWEEINAALDELPAEQKTIFEMTELHGFSFKEISESTGIGVNTLISRKRYAVLHLRERLGELYNELLSD